MENNYLGITLTPVVGNMVSGNYLLFISKLQSKMRNFAKVELSWSCRLATFKMLLLPQLLYFIRALPIPVPNSFFIHPFLKYLLNNFCGKEDIAFSKLAKSRKTGEVGHVSVKDYYTVTILTQLKAWFPTTQWV